MTITGKSCESKSFPTVKSSEIFERASFWSAITLSSSKETKLKSEFLCRSSFLAMSIYLSFPIVEIITSISSVLIFVLLLKSA